MTIDANDYHVTVFADPREDEKLPAVVRALHAELCRGRPHGAPSPRYPNPRIFQPLCVRAWLIVQRCNADLAVAAEGIAVAAEGIAVAGKRASR